MKNHILAILVLTLPQFASAETAILCGNINKIAQDNKSAAVHVDFDNDPIESKDEVKFFNIFGKKQKVSAAKYVNGVTMVRVNQQTYTFSKRLPDTCDGEQTFKVSVQPQDTKMDCICFED